MLVIFQVLTAVKGSEEASMSSEALDAMFQNGATALFMANRVYIANEGRSKTAETVKKANEKLDDNNKIIHVDCTLNKDHQGRNHGIRPICKKYNSSGRYPSMMYVKGNGEGSLRVKNPSGHSSVTQYVEFSEKMNKYTWYGWCDWIQKTTYRFVQENGIGILAGLAAVTLGFGSWEYFNQSKGKAPDDNSHTSDSQNDSELIPSTKSESKEQKEQPSKNNEGLMALIAVGSAILVFLVILGCYCKKKHSQDEELGGDGDDIEMQKRPIKPEGDSPQDMERPRGFSGFWPRESRASKGIS